LQQIERWKEKNNVKCKVVKNVAQNLIGDTVTGSVVSSVVNTKAEQVGQETHNDRNMNQKKVYENGKEEVKLDGSTEKRPNIDLRAVEGKTLLDEYGDRLVRTLTKSDDELRNGMVSSVKQSIQLVQAHKTLPNEEVKSMEALITSAENQHQSWHSVNFGPTFISDGTRHNLFSAVPAARDLGLGSVIQLDGSGFLFDKEGRKFWMRRVGNQLRIDARIYDRKGRFRTVEFVHDSGAGANIVKDKDAVLWEHPGTKTVSMGGYIEGDEQELVGGEDFFVMLKASRGSKLNNEQTLSLDVLMTEIDKEEVAPITGKVERDYDKNEADWKDFGSDDVEEVFKDMLPEQRKVALNKIKSAHSLRSSFNGKMMNWDVEGLKRSDRLSKELGIIRRMAVMEELSKQFPHLTMEAMNRMVREKDVPGGIEYRAESRLADEATLIAKGVKAKVHRKRDPTKTDPALGFRAPFFTVIVDLIDLTKETEGNRWDYNWLMVIVCKDVGTLKIYPLGGKDDVRGRWRQYKQWLNIITPYVEAKHGVKPVVRVFCADRGPEFFTTNGRMRSELDEELFKDDIARWAPSAGDSNKLGKVESLNGTIVRSINVMLRRGGAKNVWAYDAATFFEHHFNSAPTSANKLGNGEAPYKTLGIPVDYSKMVRFFCPAFVTMPKHRDVLSGKQVSQTKLTMKSLRCFIIGYGSDMTLGGDADGYKVVIASSGEVYASLNVKPTPNMEVAKSFLTGLALDAFQEGALIRNVFDAKGEESLLGAIDESVSEADTDGTVTVSEFDADEVISRTASSQDDNDESSQVAKQKAPALTRPQSPPKAAPKKTSSNRMTIGTGASGQMRTEMRAHEKKQVRTDIMTEGDSKQTINQARRKRMLMKWIVPPAEAKKVSSQSHQRYVKYWKCTTFEQFDRLCKRKDEARKADLVYDVKKGFCVFEDNPEFVDAEAERVCFAEDWEEGSSGGDVKLQFGMEGVWKQSESTNSIDENAVGDAFLVEVLRVAKSELELEEVPLWLALAVYHQAPVIVDDRVQPYTIKQAMALKEWPEWKEAIMKEVRGLIGLDVWTEVRREEVPADAKVLPGRMVLEIKTTDGKFVKCKARYVSRGDKSIRGEHWWESASHQVRSKSLRMFFAMAAVDYGRTRKECYLPRNLDIKQAYIQARRGEDEPDVYMELPEETFGLCRDKKSGWVAWMKRHLYGEVDGGRAFERELLKFLASIGAVATVSDRMVFKWVWKGDELTTLAHVDDLIYNGTCDEICDEFFALAKKYFGELTGGKRSENILGIKIEWDLVKCEVKLSQRAHAEKFLLAFGFDPATTKKKETPMPLDVMFLPNEGKRVLPSEWDYFMWCGFANWLASMTRVDFSLVTNLCGRHSHNPGEHHVEVQRHALRYLAGTLDEGLVYHGSPQVLTSPYDHTNKLIGYVDSMHGLGPDTMCVIITLNGAAVIFKVFKQRVVTTSTAHSEMIALAAGARELHWAADFMAEMGHEQGITRVLGDNQSANLQATGDYKSSKSDHYRRIQFYVEDSVRQGVMWVDKVSTEDNIADIGTKQVTPIAQFKKLRDIAHGSTPSLVMSKKVRDILDGKYDNKSKQVLIVDSIV